MIRTYYNGLWICLHFQQLPIEIFTRERTEKPVVVTAKKHVVNLNHSASVLGISIGNSLDTAHILAGNLVSFEKDEEKELATLKHLAQWAYQFTSKVSIKAPNSIQLDVKSSLKLFLGVKNIKSKLQIGLQQMGFSAQIGIHKTPLAALAIAKGGSSSLKNTPIDKLDIEPQIIEELKKIGVYSLTNILDLPQSGLTRRYGVSVIDYLKRLMGEKPDPQIFINEQPDFSSEINFLSEITNLKALLFPMRRLLNELYEFLISRQLSINTFTFKLAHRKNPTKSFHIYLTEPTSNVSTFLLLSELHLEKIRGIQEVDSLKLTARNFFPISSLSGDLFHGTQLQQKDSRITDVSDGEDCNRLFNILNARLGPNVYFQLSQENDHRPEKAWRVIPHDTRPKMPHDFVTINNRPMFLLPKPRKLKLQKNQPFLNGKLLLLHGPERIDYGWWDYNINRDYYVARDNHTNSIYWIFRDRDHQDLQWFLHGIFS
ncbi:MAG: hypothetical protein CMP95_07480 [Gammaproteobacteria bacterium]|uniref:DNA polymerase Y family protein n=1 Tax=OM182 bacterium TaxID=2510334 RepID=A0A520RZ83_9GAMM|nr:hypothetical protein [Gammaproteobacteria bacterium]OUV67857.1 MAG: hypothetical protein CBC93_03825 [Gammaproteobacteria bacterium TMED133]RZO75552.1 MAG: DNA polymerase Y family protein [OM182 bacterium]